MTRQWDCFPRRNCRTEKRSEVGRQSICPATDFDVLCVIRYRVQYRHRRRRNIHKQTTHGLHARPVCSSIYFVFGIGTMKASSSFEVLFKRKKTPSVCSIVVRAGYSWLAMYCNRSVDNMLNRQEFGWFQLYTFRFTGYTTPEKVLVTLHFAKLAWSRLIK